MLLVRFRSAGIGQTVRVPALVLDGAGALWQLSEQGQRAPWLHWQDGSLLDEDGNRLYELSIKADKGKLSLRGQAGQGALTGVKLSAERQGMSWPAHYTVHLHGLEEGWLASTLQGSWHSVLERQDELLLCPPGFSLPVPERPKVAYVRSRISPLGFSVRGAGRRAGWVS